MKNKPTKDDIQLFREAINGAKELQHNTFVPEKKFNRKVKKQLNLDKKKQDTLFYFSDEYEPMLDDSNMMSYVREDVDHHVLKRLRRGDFAPTLFLDLHGLTRQQTKDELASLLLACENENIECACIMTGHGTNTLKRQVPRWLVQYPKLLAMHKATREWGGDAAILILCEIEK